MKKALVIIAIMFMPATEAFAADALGDYRAFGPGNSSCGAVIEEYRKDSASYSYMVAWITGYFTAINSKVHDENDIWQGTDVNGAMLWIRNYCQKNPLKALTNAAEHLFVELRDK